MKSFRFKTLPDNRLKTLQEAIHNTFQRRDTRFENNHVLFSDKFAKNAKRQQDWKAFLTKMNKEMIDFQTVIQVIKDQLEPIYEQLK